MKIVAVRTVHLTGTLEHPGEFWEDRLVRPTDLYERHRRGGPRELPTRGEGCYEIEGTFVEVESDADVTGRAGPVSEGVASIVRGQLARVALGEDPRAIERIWDQLYRSSVHGRKGVTMMAISALDCALWDLKGRLLGEPVYRLLGGPTRDAVQAYASMLGHSVDPPRAAARAREFAERGYQAQKWFFKRGPADGTAGQAQNLELARALREAVGSDVDLMFDAWMSWDVPYTLAMARKLAPIEPRWIEEPVLPDKIASYAEIRRASPVPIAGGEHEYTRWGIQSLIEARAVDVLQPDVYWCGGISELLKICALASVADLPVIPHGHSVPALVHVIAAQPPNLCPLVEDLVKWNQIHEFFLKDPPKRRDGRVELSEAPGLGMELDEAKIETRRELT